MNDKYLYFTFLDLNGTLFRQNSNRVEIWKRKQGKWCKSLSGLYNTIYDNKLTESEARAKFPEAFKDEKGKE